jgi:hypothetical protein
MAPAVRLRRNWVTSGVPPGSAVVDADIGIA